MHGCTQPIKHKYREAVSVPPDSRFPTAGLAVSASPEWRCFYAGKLKHPRGKVAISWISPALIASSIAVLNADAM